jgi:hypothetical protein
MKECETALKLTEADLRACMDYLHGDVVGGAYEAACSYEYARESRTLHKAAALSKSKQRTLTEITVELKPEFPSASWIGGEHWYDIWRCAAFPQTDWNHLNDQERAEIAWLYPGDKIRPLYMMEARHVELMGINEKLKALAEVPGWGVFRSPEQVTRPRKGKVAPMVDRGGYADALFVLHFGKTKKRLVQEFEAWLDQPPIKERLEKYEGRSIGTTGKERDRLKDLAAWRLYRELGEAKAEIFIEKHRKRDGNGNTRPFHDSRKSEGLPPNETSLYGHRTGPLKATARARKHLIELMPCEFDTRAEEESFKAAMAAFKKASKSSS